MKMLTIALFTLLSTSSFALLHDPCFSKTKKAYLKVAQPSDTKRTFEFKEYLPQGELLIDAGKTLVDGFEEDMLIYVATGSYHSGYFRDVIAVNPKNCLFYEVYNSYSE